jgi:hypothetical protein
MQVQMRPAPELLIWARRRPNDWRRAAYRLSDVRRLNRDDSTDGRFAGSCSSVYGYVRCDAIQDGERLHPCRGGEGLHEIKICIAKKDNEQIFNRLLELCALSEAPPETQSANAPEHRMRLAG